MAELSCWSTGVNIVDFPRKNCDACSPNMRVAGLALLTMTTVSACAPSTLASRQTVIRIFMEVSLEHEIKRGANHGDAALQTGGRSVDQHAVALLWMDSVQLQFQVHRLGEVPAQAQRVRALLRRQQRAAHHGRQGAAGREAGWQRDRTAGALGTAWV